MITAVAVPRSDPRGKTLRSALMVVIAGMGLLGFSASCTDVAPIDRLTIVNRTPYDVDVMVSDAKKEGWLLLGRATHGSSTVNQLVTDMGPTWVFRFHFGRETVGELTRARQELERARWSLEVPSGVADRMRELGFEPPPER